jgi:hypothetical protein
MITGTEFDVRDNGRCSNSSSLAMKKAKTQADKRLSLCITSVKLIQFLAFDLPGVRVMRRPPLGKAIRVIGLARPVGTFLGCLTTSRARCLVAPRFRAVLRFVARPGLSGSIKDKRIPSWSRRSSSSSSSWPGVEDKRFGLPQPSNQHGSTEKGGNFIIVLPNVFAHCCVLHGG